MFKALMSVQWKWTRGAALLATILGFAVPLASVSEVNDHKRGAGELLAWMQNFGVAYSVLAGVVGLAFGLLAWSADHKGRHVYALSLPISRSRYAAMRFGAGALFLLLPAFGVLAGSLVALSIADIPAGLHGYPFSLTFRFLLASAVAFALLFATASTTPKAAGAILGAIAALLVASFLLAAASSDVQILGMVYEFLFSGSGPFTIFTGRWMLIDA